MSDKKLVADWMALYMHDRVALDEESLERLCAKARLQELTEARRLLGTGRENFNRWLAMRVQDLQAACGDER